MSWIDKMKAVKLHSTRSYLMNVLEEVHVSVKQVKTRSFTTAHKTTFILLKNEIMHGGKTTLNDGLRGWLFLNCRHTRSWLRVRWLEWKIRLKKQHSRESSSQHGRLFRLLCTLTWLPCINTGRGVNGGESSSADTHRFSESTSSLAM